MTHTSYKLICLQERLSSAHETPPVDHDDVPVGDKHAIYRHYQFNL